MLKRTAHTLFYLLMGVLVAAVLVGAAVAWRLSQGPVSLSWAVPTLEFLINRATPNLHVEIADLVVSWTDWAEGLDVRFLNVAASTPDGAPIAHVPELSVALSSDALRDFRLAPTEIHLYRPLVNLIRRKDGTLEFALAEGEGSATPFSAFVQSALATPRDPADPLSYLDVVTITNGRIVYRDRQLDAVWAGRLAKGQLVRAARSMSLDARVALSAGQERALADIDGFATAATGAMALQVRFQNFRPAPFAAVTPALSPLQSVDLPLAGTARIETGSDGTLRQLSFDVSGGSGRLELTAPLAAQFGLDEKAAQKLDVRELALRGRYDATSGSVEMEPSAISFADNTSVYLPGPIDQTFPLASVAAQGRYDIDADAASDVSIDLDLGGAKVKVDGEARALGGDLSGAAHIYLGRVKVDNLALYWPKIVASGGRDWALAHLSSGSLEQGDIYIEFGPTGKGTDVTKLSGQGRASRLQVDYLPPAPPLRNATGTATFDLQSLKIAIDSGETSGLTVTGGTAVISDLRADAPTLRLETAIRGTVPAALRFLAHEPFGYTKNIAINTAESRGDVVSSLELTLPLVKDPEIEDVKLRARGDVSNLFIPDALIGGNVTGGNLHLDIDEKGMDVLGPVSFENIAGRVAWHENFAVGAPYLRRIDLAVPSMSIDALRRIEPSVVATLDPWVDGPLAAQSTVIFKNERDIDFDVDVDASQAALNFPPLGWAKERGKRTFMFAKGRFVGDHLAEVSRASISAPALEASGSVAFSGKGTLERVIVDRLISGNTDASAIVTAMPGGGWDVVIGGNRLDVHPLLEGEHKATEGTDTAALDNFTLSADLDRLWLEADTPIRAVSATVVRERGVFRLVQVEGLVGDGSPVTVDIAPAGASARTLRVRADNAGSALRAFNIFPDFQGGELRIDGMFDDIDPHALALDGTLKIKRFHLIRAPILAQILNVMALTGVIELLRGEGIAFDTLDVPFSLRDDLLTLSEAKMHGTALGATASGTYDIARDLIDVRGTLVPFYVLNSLLGRLPLIGGLFSGGERGGGLFAVSYGVTGTMAQPNISVNPVSMLTPGILRNIFSIFDRTPPQDTFSPAPNASP
ncbi:MAG: hypothetical protein JNM75_04510 [Rhodospirillales bacterium]|nr:hypothetical protein [Rhodospirillales bacterium]